jgi:DNA-3-methyladenine glycosylase
MDEKKRQRVETACPSWPRLAPKLYQTGTEELAVLLLGKLLVRRLGTRRLSGWIVETEAYLAADDPASHSFRGPRPRNQSMFAPAGTLYVYSIHAKHCLNVVAEEAGVGAAVLIRALEPREGLEQMKAASGRSDRDLARGPARLCQVMSVDRAMDGTDLLTSPELWIEHPVPDWDRWRIGRSERIGISQARDRQLRFFIDGNRHVSGPAKNHSIPNRDLLGEPRELAGNPTASDEKQIQQRQSGG